MLGWKLLWMTAVHPHFVEGVKRWDRLRKEL